MRLSILSLTLGLSITGVVGCGDDHPVNPDAPRAIDAPPAPDAPPAHLFKGYQADEGGEVKMEYLLFPNGNAGSRVQRFVLKTAGTPAYHTYPTFNACTNVDKGQNLFPSAQNTDRAYADPGLVLISNPAGTTPTMTLRPNAAAGNDSVGRSHPAGMFTVADGAGGPFMGSMSTSGALVPEKTSFDVTFTGSADLPAQTFKDAIWMPAAVTLINPPMGTYVLLAGVDQTITMSTPANETGKPADVEIREFVALAGAQGVSIFCIDDMADQAVKITAAAADIARAKYPTGGVMARMNNTHRVKELIDFNGPTGRRIDFIANWCNSTPFSVP